MTTISTIKPAGGGDFSDLASWEDWSDNDPNGQGNAAYWAECYKGNLGANVFMDMTSPAPTAADHRKIFAGDGQQHDGKHPTAGAYIGAATPGDFGLLIFGENFVEVIGIGVQAPRDGIGINCNDTEEVLIDGCLIEKTGGYLFGIIVLGSS